MPVGPTRRADSRTSIPPPEPRSRTVSPSLNSASAVGLPQPSDASMASGGTASACSGAYRFDVIGSGQQRSLVPQPQVAGWPWRARSAACPYRCWTTSLMLSMAAVSPICVYANINGTCYIRQDEYLEAHGG